MGFGNAAAGFMTGFMQGYKFIDDIQTKKAERDAAAAKAQQELDDKAIAKVDAAQKISTDARKEIKTVTDEIFKLYNESTIIDQKTVDEANSKTNYINKIIFDTNQNNEAVWNEVYSNEKVYRSGKLDTLDKPFVPQSNSLFIPGVNGTPYVVPYNEANVKIANAVNNGSALIDEKGFLKIKTDTDWVYANDTLNKVDDATRSANISLFKKDTKASKTDDNTLVLVSNQLPIIQAKIKEIFGDNVSQVTRGDIKNISKGLIDAQVEKSKSNEQTYVANALPELKKQYPDKTEEELKVIATKDYQRLGSDMGVYVKAYMKENPNATELQAMNAFKLLVTEANVSNKTIGALNINTLSGASSIEVKNQVQALPPKERALTIQAAQESPIYQKHIKDYSNLVSDTEKIVSKIDNITRMANEGKLKFKGIVGSNVLELISKVPTSIGDWSSFQEANKAAINSAIADQSIVGVVFASLSQNVKGVPSNTDLEYAQKLATGIQNGNAATVKEALSYFKKDAIESVDKYYKENANILGITNSKDYDRIEQLKGGQRADAAQMPSPDQAKKMFNTLTPKEIQALESGKTIRVGDYEFYKTSSEKASMRRIGGK